MRQVTWAAALLVSSLALAGCSGGGNDPATAEVPEPEFEVEATATTGVIRGVVVDETITPILDVVVTIAASGQNATTNTDGLFAFADLVPGTYFLNAAKHGFTSVQTSVDVVAGDSEPPITKVILKRIESLQPYFETYHLQGYLSFGAAIIVTSIGTTIYGPLADTLGDRSIWDLTFTQLPMWAQGELVWEQTQPAGGEFIWEMTEAGSNSPVGYRETTSSPALAYWNTTVLIDHNETVLDPERGIAYRFFGGPHPLCKPAFFGCGITVQQKAEAFIHNFFNFAPPPGWRYTVDGDPVVPTP